jgi:two-component system, NtrC family, sensor kinase
MKRIEATSELFRAFASDESEKANIEAVNILAGFFAADAAALFYLSGRKEHRFCLAGTEFPIGLTEERWMECISRAEGGEGKGRRFGPWAIPGIDTELAAWIGSELYQTGGGVGYIILGRRERPWTDEEALELSIIARTVAPIVRSRIERERAEFVRRQVEQSLAASDKRLRSFIEDSHDMIYAANADDIVTSINAAGLELLRKERHEVLGHPFAELALNPQDREPLVRRVLEDGYASDYEIILERSDGETVFCLETSHGYKGADGGIIEIQGIVKDISERIKDEREMWKANLELAEANMKLQRTQSIMVQQEKLASIGQLAAGVAHEINNPLGFLKSNHATLVKYVRTFVIAWRELRDAALPAASALEERLGLKDIFDDLESLFAESDDGFARIIRIVASLKNFSRAEYGEALAPYDVNAGIESTLVVAWNELKYVAEVKKDFGEVPHIQARGGELNQVILNILVNAAQAIASQGKNGKGNITISTRVRGESVVITIADDGPGMPKAVQSKIFDPFFTTKDPGSGTGLGLSISYDIVVAKHGGSLHVSSEPGEGAAFIIELPIAGPPPPAPTPMATPGT